MTKLIGTDPNQVPSNADLGTLAYQDADNANLGTLLVTDKIGIDTSGTDTLNSPYLFTVADESHGVAIDYVSAYPTKPGGLFSTAGGSTWPFNQWGNLILSTRTDYGGYYDIALVTASSNNTPVARLVVKSSGNVGIGTDSPDASLHVVGSNDNNLIVQNSTYQASGQNTEAAIRFKVTASADAERAKAGIHFKNDGSAYGRGDLYFTVDSNDDNGNVDINDTKMMITHEGSVGIGEVSPDRLFHVKRSDTGGTVAKFENSAGTVYIELNTDNQAGGDAGYLSYDSNQNLGLWTDDTQRITITSDGRIGVGEGAGNVGHRDVEGKMDLRMDMSGVNWTHNDWASVWDSIGTPGANFNKSVLHIDTNRFGGSTGGIVGIAFSPGWQGHQNWGIYSHNRSGGSYSEGDLSFVNQLNAGNIQERVRFLANGNVGIGTDSPGKLLTLSRATEAQNEQLEFRNVGGISNGNFDGIRWSQGSTGGTTLAEQRINYYTTGVVDMSFNLRNEDNVLYLKAGGNVGIGTSNPTRNLDVAGVLSADNYDWGSSNAVFGQDRYKIRELNNWFWAAGKRFGGYGNSSNLHNSMFDGNFDNGHTFAANSTHVITIDHRNQNTLTYPSGDAYFSFYHVYNQFTSITGRAYHTAGSNSGNWSNLGTATDINGGPGSGGRVVKLSGPPGNYIGMWEFTIVTGSSSVVVTDLSYHMTRATGENSSPAFRVDRQQDVVHTTNYRNDSGTLVGTIVPTSSGCTFNNLSDYRFKQNVTDITGASDRLKLLKPKNFSWITDETDTLEDGFLAHEVAEVVPNAVIGEKDAVVPPELYSENDPIPEGSSVGDVKLENGEMEPQLLDQVKLIPLLTAALKEALDRIEVLEQG